MVATVWFRCYFTPLAADKTICVLPFTCCYTRTLYIVRTVLLDRDGLFRIRFRYFKCVAVFRWQCQRNFFIFFGAAPTDYTQTCWGSNPPWWRVLLRSTWMHFSHFSLATRWCRVGDGPPKVACLNSLRILWLLIGHSYTTHFESCVPSVCHAVTLQSIKRIFFLVMGLISYTQHTHCVIILDRVKPLIGFVWRRRGTLCTFYIMYLHAY